MQMFQNHANQQAVENLTLLRHSQRDLWSGRLEPSSTNRVSLELGHVLKNESFGLVGHLGRSPVGVVRIVGTLGGKRPLFASMVDGLEQVDGLRLWEIVGQVAVNQEREVVPLQQERRFREALRVILHQGPTHQRHQRRQKILPSINTTNDLLNS